MYVSAIKNQVNGLGKVIDFKSLDHDFVLE